MVISALPDSTIPVGVMGNQLSPLIQKATTFELNTNDTNLSTVVGNARLYALLNGEAAVAPSAPTAPTSGVIPWAYKQPQLWPRMRVESGGSQKLPFNQIPNTNDISNQDVPLRTLMEKFYVQFTLYAQAMLDANNVTYPNGWELIK
jgi:hypothetical protein